MDQLHILPPHIQSSEHLPIINQMILDALTISDPLTNNKTHQYIHINGTFSSGNFQSTGIYQIKYSYILGYSWEQVDGLQQDTSQQASIQENKMTWCFPFYAILKAKNVTGWPKVLVEVFGENSFGKQDLLGVGCFNIPANIGQQNIKCYCFKPKSDGILNTISQFFGGLNQGNYAQFIKQMKSGEDMAGNFKQLVTKVKCTGFVEIKLEVLLRNFQQKGYQIE